MADMKQLQRERDEARYYARVLAHAYMTDICPPQLIVAAALAYPVVPDGMREAEPDAAPGEAGS